MNAQVDSTSPALAHLQSVRGVTDMRGWVTWKSTCICEGVWLYVVPHLPYPTPSHI